MKKTLLLFLLCLIFNWSALSQNTDYYDRMEHIFGNIDKTKVSTGFLKEFGIRFNEVEAYNGVISATNWVDKTQWQSLYSSLYTMRVGTVAASMTAPTIVFDNLKYQQSNTSEVLLAAQYYTYQQYKANAYTNGDVSIINEKIYDVAGRNPYEAKTIFVVSPLKKQIEGNSFSFKLPSNLIYTNIGLTLSQVQVDFGNGQGYQTISLNTAKSVTYSSGGEKEIKVKFVYNGGPTLYSHSKIWVDYLPSNPQARFNGSGATLHSITGDSYLGTSATGLVTVELAPGHTQLTKPLIVVEGFDPDNSFNYFDFINRDDPGAIDVEIDGTGLTLNQAIEDENYDLVFVNFANGTDHIQRNAYMVEQVIRWVNAQKLANGSTEKNVVLGMSMGGLVARYALRDMELNSEVHDTKLYISHDAPHQGANIPLAYQAMVRHLVGEEVSLPVFLSLFDITILDLADQFPDLQDGLALLQTPAAQQMLIFQLQGTGDGVSINSNTLQNNFLNEYKTMGYPSQGGIRNIAIANGSECGTPLGFNPYDPLVNVDINIDVPLFLANVALGVINGLSLNPLKILSSAFSTNTDIKAQFNLRALPNQQSNQIYKGKIFIKKTILFIINVEEQLIDEKTLNSSSSMLPLDNTNGGVFNIDTFVSLPPELNTYVLEREFNFIPTFSSLDIGGGNQVITYSDLTKAYSPLSPPLAPKNTPFDNFYTNPTTSERHIQFTLINGNWLMDELDDDNLPAFYSCAASCVGQLTLNIAGPNSFCSTGTYSIGNLTSASEVQVNWSVIPVASATLSTTNNSATLTRNPSFSGMITLTASIGTGNANCVDIPVVKQIYIGTPTVVAKLTNGEYISHGSSNMVCKYEQMKTNMTVNGQTNVSWTLLNSSHTTSWSQQGNNVTFYLWAVNHTATFRFTTTNSCGTITRDYTFVSKNCSGGGDPCDQSLSYRIYPNPTSTSLKIEPNMASQNIPAPCKNAMIKDENSKEKFNGTPSIATLYNFKGRPVKTIIPAQGIMDVQDLTAGHYILVISHDDKTESHHIIID